MKHHGGQTQRPCAKCYARFAARGLAGTITFVLDNARYQAKRQVRPGRPTGITFAVPAL